MLHSNMLERNVPLIILSFVAVILCCCILLWCTYNSAQTNIPKIWVLCYFLAWHPKKWVLHWLVFLESSFQGAKWHSWRKLAMSQRTVPHLPSKHGLGRTFFFCSALNRRWYHQSNRRKQKPPTPAGCREQRANSESREYQSIVTVSSAIGF